MFFSVVVPVYNGSKHLPDAIESLLSQKDICSDEYEIIVINDGSDDAGATRECAQSYGEKIRYYEKENGGVSSALNLGISTAKGEYICWLSHDDVFYENKLASQKKAIKSLREDGVENFVLFARQSYMDAHGQPLWKKRSCAEETNKLSIYSSSEALSLLVSGKLAIGGCTIAIPKKLFNDDFAGLFVENYRYIQDLVMWVKMSLYGASFVYQDTLIVKSRVHANQQTGRFQKRLYNESRDFNNWLIQNLGRFKLNDFDGLLSSISFILGKYRMFQVFFKEGGVLAKSPNRIGKLKCFSQFVYGFFQSYVLSIYRKIINILYR